MDFPMNIKYDTIAVKQEDEGNNEGNHNSMSTFDGVSNEKSDLIKFKENSKYIKPELNAKLENCGRHNNETKIIDFPTHRVGIYILPIDMKNETVAIKQECEAMDPLFTTVEIKSNADSNLISESQENDFRLDIHRCDICRQRYLSSAEALVAHRYSHTWDTNFTCLICQNTFNMKQRMERHMLKKHSNFIAIALSTHKVNHSNKILAVNKRYECGNCHKRFTFKGNLARHERIHSGVRPYECEICHKRFTQSSAVVIHKRIHSGDKRFECDTCLKRFTELRDLTIHKRNHSGEKPYECDTCHERFRRLSTVVTHKRIHSGEKPYGCDNCEKRFARSTILNIHKRVHSGEKPYECDKCHKRFSVHSSLTRHNRIHTGEKPYECDMCHKRFIESGHLTKHLRMH